MKDEKLSEFRKNLALITAPLAAVQLGTFAYMIKTNKSAPFVAYCAVSIPAAFAISKYYYNSVSFKCPECGEVFKPLFKEVFFANHMFSKRKLRCPVCGMKEYCEEVSG